MKILSLFLLTLFFGVNFTFAQSSIESSVKNFTTDPLHKNASIGFKLVDLSTQKTIYSYDAERTLPTASTAKLFSTATALEILGPDYQAKTRIYIDGKIDSLGVLHGNVWVRGGGDPSLGSKYFHNEDEQYLFFEEWAKILKKANIKRIKGNIIADASEFGYNGAPDGWSWVDMGNYYGAGPSGLTVGDNLVQLHFKTGAKVDQQTVLIKIHPFVPELIYHNYVVTSQKRGDNSYIYGAPYSMDRFITGTLPINNDDFIVKGSLPDPERQVAYLFSSAIEKAGIELIGTYKGMRNIGRKNKEYDKMRLLFTHKGQQLIDIIKKTNFKSINLFAEHLVCLIGYQKTGEGSTEKGLEIIESYWKNKLGFTSMHLTDGSGLSRMNAISATHFTSLLYYMNTSKYREVFFNSLPVAGESGTLKAVCRGQAGQGRVFAKSGTMRRIKSYAGYIHSKSGKKYAFAITINNPNGSLRNVRKKMEVIFNTIANQ